MDRGGANSNEYSSKSSGEATKLGRSDMQLDQVFMEGEQTKFVVTQKNYTKQFASIYYNRLELLRPCVEQSVERAIGKVVSQSLLSRVMNLERGKDCILCGTLYKDMKLKPCILDEYADEVCSLRDCFLPRRTRKTREIVLHAFATEPGRRRG